MNRYRLIPSGVLGVRETLYTIVDIAKEDVSLPLPGIPDGISVWELDAYLRSKWAYAADEANVTRGIRAQGQHFVRYGSYLGDCKSAAVVVVHTLLRSGVDSAKLVAVRRPDESSFSHVFIVVMSVVMSAGVVIDPTVTIHPDYSDMEREELPLWEAL